MKKAIAFLTALTLLMLLFPCAVLAEGEARRDIPLDSEEFKTLEHEVFEVNHLEALLEKHTSVTFDMTETPANDYGLRNYWYITRNACYFEVPDGALYEYDRVFYDLYTPDEGTPELIYGLDMRSDYDLWDTAGYQFPPKGDEASWFNSEIEEHVSCYTEDGLLYLIDKRNAEASESWFAVNMPFETYDGEIMYSEVIADAETKEIIAINNYLESKDGVMTRVLHHTAAYDEPEPRRVLNMRAAFERYCENTIEVTMVVDPGTDREFSKSLTVPVGSLLNFRSDNPDRAIICDDPDVTVVTHFDGMQSRTFYILTEPSAEQVERYGELLQALQASRES